ncbi:MAG: nitroreductase family protein [Bacteroidales bacterium]|nr:nitroreductase family protein [Bacteroidales bacterium]
MSIKATFIYAKAKKTQAIIQLFFSYWYDFNRYIKYSNTFNTDANANKLRATIILNYHVIEKGLTMSEMKHGFGEEKVLYLCEKCNDFINRFGNNDKQVNHAIQILETYLLVHEQNNFKLPESIIKKIKQTITLKEEDIISTLNYEEKTIDYKTIKTAPFPVFAKSRKSIRNFSKRNIEPKTIEKAVANAQTSPSACNRQPARIHIYSEKNLVTKILYLQNGNRGFGHLSNKLIIVSCDLSGYKIHNERNSCWVDGGIYLMNLLYGLHYEGIGTCILKWSVSCKINKRT